MATTYNNHLLEGTVHSYLILFIFNWHTYLCEHPLGHVGVHSQTDSCNLKKPGGPNNRETMRNPCWNHFLDHVPHQIPPESSASHGPSRSASASSSAPGASHLHLPKAPPLAGRFAASGRQCQPQPGGGAQLLGRQRRGTWCAGMVGYQVGVPPQYTVAEWGCTSLHR